MMPKETDIEADIYLRCQLFSIIETRRTRSVWLLDYLTYDIKEYLKAVRYLKLILMVPCAFHINEVRQVES